MLGVAVGELLVRSLGGIAVVAHDAASRVSFLRALGDDLLHHLGVGFANELDVRMTRHAAGCFCVGEVVQKPVSSKG